MCALYTLLVHSHALPSTITFQLCWCVSNTFLVMVCNLAGGGGDCIRVVEGARDGGGTVVVGMVIVSGGVMWWITHGHILTVPI